MPRASASEARGRLQGLVLSLLLAHPSTPPPIILHFSLSLWPNGGTRANGPHGDGWLNSGLLWPKGVGGSEDLGQSRKPSWSRRSSPSGYEQAQCVARGGGLCEGWEGWEAGSGRAGARCVRRGGDRARAQFGSLQGTQLPKLPSPHGGGPVAGSQSREAAVPALGGVQHPFPDGRREGGEGKVTVVAEEAGCPWSDRRTEAAARRPLQAWLPGLPVHAGLTFCVGQPVPSCAGPCVAAPPWACSARGLPLHQLRGLEGRGRTGGVHVAEEELGARDSVSSYEGPWQSGLHAPQQDFRLSLELSI